MHTNSRIHTHTHTQVDPDERTVSANEKPHFVKLCSGMPKEAGTGRPLSVAELTASPVSACGHAKGGCQSNVRIHTHTPIDTYTRTHTHTCKHTYTYMILFFTCIYIDILRS